MALTTLGHGPARPRFAPFALGYRPFFLVAALGGVLLMALWMAAYLLGWWPESHYGPLAWHGHEMVFGFGGAVVAGFLLTAVRNWTDIATPTGRGLMALVLLWLAARVLCFLPGAPLGVALVDLAFFPTLAAVLIRPLFRGGEPMRWLVMAIVLGLFAANVLVHMAALGLADTTHAGLYLGALLLVVAIIVLGGRVIPVFIARAVPGFVAGERRWLEQLSPWSVVLLGLTLAVNPQGPMVAPVALVAALANGLRLAGWYGGHIWRNPMLWVLLLGYGWVVAGLALVGLAALGVMALPLALHGLTVGGVGLLTVGMMSRVSLGHSGHPMVATGPVVLAFHCMTAAVAVRVLAPLGGASYSWVIGVSGGLWLLTWGLWLTVFAPILLRSAKDGTAD